jgi:hypothetical protein
MVVVPTWFAARTRKAMSFWTAISDALFLLAIASAIVPSRIPGHRVDLDTARRTFVGSLL